VKVKFIERRFSANSLLIVQRSNQIIAEYEAKGLKLTLRQLFYQHVARPA
jgi:hypothetical protein